MTDKTALRAEARIRRAAAHGSVDPTPALEALARVLGETTGPVAFYWPIRTEIDPRPIMIQLAETRRLCLPVTHGRDAPLTFRAWHPGAEMDVDGFGVAIPADDMAVTPQVLVVPLLAFDRHLHRLGYGAGHYDRTLAGLRPNRPTLAIGLAYEAQHAALLPAEPTDQALDLIVTEVAVHRLA